MLVTIIRPSEISRPPQERAPHGGHVFVCTSPSRAGITSPPSNHGNCTRDPSLQVDPKQHKWGKHPEPPDPWTHVALGPGFSPIIFSPSGIRPDRQASSAAQRLRSPRLPEVPSSPHLVLIRRGPGTLDAFLGEIFTWRFWRVFSALVGLVVVFPVGFLDAITGDLHKPPPVPQFHVSGMPLELAHSSLCQVPFGWSEPLLANIVTDITPLATD